MTVARVGNAEIISLLDMSAAFPLSVTFPQIEADRWAPYIELYPGAVVDGMLHTNFQPFVIRSAGQTILVDMGAGPGPHEGLGGASGQLRDEMRKNGLDPNDVTTVIFTHLHFDHIGWAVVDGKPFCPRARYLAPEADWA